MLHQIHSDIHANAMQCSSMPAPDAQQSTTNNGIGIMRTWVLQLVRLSEPAAAFALLLLLFPWPWPYV